MHLERTVVFDQPELAELVHEVVDARARGADARRHHFLADRRSHRAQFCLLRLFAPTLGTIVSS